MDTVITDLPPPPPTGGAGEPPPPPFSHPTPLWRHVFPVDAGLVISIDDRLGRPAGMTSTAIKVAPKFIHNDTHDPSLTTLETYTQLPEQSLAFETNTFIGQVRGLEVLAASMKAYAAAISTTVPEWQQEVDQTIASLNQVLWTSNTLMASINSKLDQNGTLNIPPSKDVKGPSGGATQQSLSQ